MPSPFPSIQSFFSSPSKATPSTPPPLSQSPLPSSNSKQTPAKDSTLRDGFSSDEVELILNPPSAQWTPVRDYDEVDIGALEPGPKYLTFVGRVVNVYDQLKPSKRPQAARGCLKIMVGDDSGAVTVGVTPLYAQTVEADSGQVRLWYANAGYQTHIGQLVTVWTLHISHGGQSSLAPTSAPLFTSIFPERERHSYIMFHQNSDNGIMCKKPYKCKDTQTIPSLMTLRNFTEGGYDVDNGKLLVCVKSIGARKKFTNKHGNPVEVISMGVFDDTAEASLTLYGAACGSASHWQPSHTVLLISNPGWRIDRMAKLSLNANTRIDVGPDMADALWLRSLAQRLTKREHINPPWPTGIFDTEAAETASVRILYTLANIDEFARANPKERFMGYISVLITELNIVTIFRRQMLMSTECCGIPLYANAIIAQCKQCNRPIPLRINPKIIGPIIDETGQISSGKLIFSDAAWEQLLGRTPEQLVKTDIEVLRYLEQRLLFLRVSLGFGWCIEGSEPLAPENDDEEITKMIGRKRKRLDLFKSREKAAENIQQEDQEKEKMKAEAVKSVGSAKMVSDGVGEVGRLCIWCVKM